VCAGLLRARCGAAALSDAGATLPDMKRSRAPESRLPVFPLAGLAALAVVLGHQLVYRLAVPSSAERAALLARTGHAYLPTIAHLALLAALAAIGGMFLRSVTRRDDVTPSRWTTFGRLATVQVSIFVFMELAERIVAGAPIAGVATHGLLFLGVAVQLLLAFAFAALVSLLRRAGAAIAELAASSPRLRPALVVSLPAAALVRSERHRGTISSRGPPSP
jgi:hypothetical protein